MYKFLFVGIVVLSVASCDRESPYSKLLTEDYPKLYSHVFERNADSMLVFTEHSDPFIREQAWRSLIITEVNEIEELITKVQYDNSMAAWTALSSKSLSDEQLSRLHDLWERRTSMRNGISLVLGKQGNQTSLDYLVRNFEGFMDTGQEYETALAISRLMMNHVMSEGGKRSLFRYAAILDDTELFQAYFYGMYRSGRGVESDEMRQTLFETYDWTDLPGIKQYVAKILFNTDAEWFFERLKIDGVQEMDVQLAIELAQHSGKINWNDKLSEFYGKLLDHSNPLVNEVGLVQIGNHSNKPDAFDEIIKEKIIYNEEKESSIRLTAIHAISDKSNYLEMTDNLSMENKYFLPKKLSIYQTETGTSEYLDLVSTYLDSENTTEVALALQHLSGWLANADEDLKDQSNIEQVRNLIFDVMGRKDPTLTANAVGLLSSVDLVISEDLDQLTKLTSEYSLPEGSPVFQALGNLLMEHFKQEGQEIIDAIIQKENPSLNNILREQGWDVPGENQPKKFREPDWKRLGDLGNKPVWVLETQKGAIKIAMDVLSAPATISGIDSLTRAGAYDGVAFHRVVPNFVIQGGDVETGLGNGGPNFSIPTEASEKEYKRGMAGMARSEIDTEGSQYFIMHQWKPHLNAGYTIIGKVIEGMETVDNILYGDMVTKAYWQPRD